MPLNEPLHESPAEAKAELASVPEPGANEEEPPSQVSKSKTVSDDPDEENDRASHARLSEEENKEEIKQQVAQDKDKS